MGSLHNKWLIVVTLLICIRNGFLNSYNWKPMLQQHWLYINGHTFDCKWFNECI